MRPQPLSVIGNSPTCGGKCSHTLEVVLNHRACATYLASTLDYTPIDISPTIVMEHGRKLLGDYPLLRINALICDYVQALDLLREPQEEPRLFIFLGSSVCNYAPEEANDLLRRVAADRGGAFGWHRSTLGRVAAALSMRSIVDDGLASAGWLASEAIVARAGLSQANAV